MILIPTGVRVWLATGHTDMRCGFPSLALRVQEVLKHNPMGGGLFCFRGKRGDLLKVIWHDGQGACLFTKRLERGRFIWPSVAGEAVPRGSLQIPPGAVSQIPPPARQDMVIVSLTLFPGQGLQRLLLADSCVRRTQADGNDASGDRGSSCSWCCPPGMSPNPARRDWR